MTMDAPSHLKKKIRKSKIMDKDSQEDIEKKQECGKFLYQQLSTRNKPNIQYTMYWTRQTNLKWPVTIMLRCLALPIKSS